MELLTAVNGIMPKLGERPVTSLATPHPTLAVILPIIEQKQRDTLKRGWWFNEYNYTAQPDVDGIINLGVDTLRFIPDCRGTVATRGTRLFDMVNLTDVFTAGVPGRVTQNLPFDELPESMAQYVFYAGMCDAYATDIGVTAELGEWKAFAALGWSDVVAEHLAQRRPNTRDQRAFRKLRRAMSS
jgi:hypothetical protein